MLSIFWHTNPDTDAICSAIVAADLYDQLGISSQAFRLGDLNPETKYVLESAGVSVPDLFAHDEQHTEVLLVDHNSSSQSYSGLESCTIVGYIDHHTVENFNTPVPTFMRFEAYCSTCTILYTMYQEKGLTVSDTMAMLMLAGILSDSLAFRSPTTTDYDIAVADELAQQLRIDDLQAYAKKMFDAKSDLGDISVRDLVTMDYKEFDFGNTKVGIGVVETTNPAYSFRRKDEILADLQSLKNTSSLDLVLFSIVDILEEKNTMYCLGEQEQNVVEKVFGVQVTDSEADLGSRVSRKKQIVPDLKEYFS